jgi:transposase
LVKHYLTDDSIIYEIDDILKADEHTVLKLPPYNCQYNPIEVGWADCKNYYNKHIPSRLDSTGRVKEVWREALVQCTKSGKISLNTLSKK